MRKLYAVASILALALASATQAATIYATDSATIYTPTPSVSGSGATMFVGNSDGSNDGAANKWAEVSFQLPDLGVQANPFSVATLTLTVNGTEHNNSYGNQVSSTVGLTSGGTALTRASGTVLGTDVGASSVYTGPQFSYTDQTALGQYSSGDISSYLNQAYAGGAGVGQFVFFQVQASGGLQWYKGLYIAGASDTAVNAPQITYTSVPEPTSLGLLGLAGAGLLARRRRA